MAHFTERFDQSLKRIKHYQQFPELLPWIGEEYDSKDHKKLLLIGESHYLPANSIIHLDSSTWYGSTSKELNNEERGWINTREIINSGCNRSWEPSGHRIYKNIEQAILDSGFQPQNKENTYRYVAYYNFFQRPGSKSLMIKDDDERLAISLFNDLLTILDPHFVIFVSRKAWNTYNNWSGFELQQLDGRYTCRLEKDFLVDFCPHPAKQWWYRSSEIYRLFGDTEPRTGKERFIGLLHREKIFPA